MIDHILRSPKEQVLRPLAKRLADLEPTSVTLLALGIGLGAVVALIFKLNALALGLWLLNRLLDGLDGELARLTGKQTDLGGYLDILVDYTVYAAIPITLALTNPSPLNVIAIVTLLGFFYLNTASWMYLAALLEKRNLGSSAQNERTSITMPTGLIEGAETVVFYCLFIVFPYYLATLFFIMSGLLLITTVQRLRWAFKHL